MYLKNFFKIFFITISLYIDESYSKLKFINGISAIVGNNIILESDVEKKIQYMKIYEKNFLKKDFYCKKIEALNQLIIDNIILQSASSMHIEITDAQVNQVINNIIRNNNINKKQFCLFLKKSLIDYNFYYCQIKKEIILSKIFNQEIYQEIFLFPKEVEFLSNQIYFPNFNTIKLCVDQFFLPKSKFEQTILKKIKSLNCSPFYKNKNIKNIKSLISKIFSFNKIDMNKRCTWKNVKDLPLVFTIHIKNIKKGNIIGPIYKCGGLYIFLIEDVNWKNVIDNVKLYVQKLSIKDRFLSRSKKKIKRIFKKIKMGDISFNDAIRNCSDNIEISTFTGSIKWIKIKDIDNHFFDKIKNLKFNEISYPFYFSNSWNIVKILDVCLENKDLNIIKKNIISQFLFNKISYEKTIHWIEEQKMNFYIKILN